MAGALEVDVTGLWGQGTGGAPISASPEDYLEAASVQYQPCDPNRINVDPSPRDVAVLRDAEATKVLMVPGFGVRLLTRSPGSGAGSGFDLARDLCAGLGELNGSVLLAGLDAVQDYSMDLDGDGEIRQVDGVDAETLETLKKEVRDYVVVTHALGYVLVFDVTDAPESFLAAKIRLGNLDQPAPRLADLTIDRRARRIYVTAFGRGIYAVDFNSLPSTLSGDPVAFLDLNQDGEDDRVLEQVRIDEGNDALSLAIMPEMGLVWTGGRERGLNGLMQAMPEIYLVSGQGALRRLAATAPFGVPNSVAGDLPGTVRVIASLPGLGVDGEDLASLGQTIQVDLVSTTPEGAEIDGVMTDGLPNGVPGTAWRDAEALELRQLATQVYEDGYRIYLSEPVALIADLRAAIRYERSGEEGKPEVCRRCDQVTEGVYSQTPGPADDKKEMLSGHRLTARFSSGNTGLAGFYEGLPILRHGVEIESVPWDLSPSEFQEPANHPSYGFGEVAPGTLLHSGEFSHDMTDLALPGRGVPLAFSRTYRNQTLGDGPLGPGWDFGYRMRLRELPNGDVDFFDGRGRRETFTLASDASESDLHYLSPPGQFSTLHRVSEGFSLRTRANVRYLFDSDGRLRSIQDTAFIGEGTGTELMLFYDSHSRLIRLKSVGRVLTFEYNETGRLSRVADDTGRDVKYTFSEGLLEKVESPEVELALEGSVRRLETIYSYEDAVSDLSSRLNRRDNLKAIADPTYGTMSGQPKWLEQTYEVGADGKGRRVESQHLAGDFIGLTWYESGGEDLTQVTDRRFNAFLFAHNAAGHLTRYTTPAVTDAEGQPAGDSVSTTWSYGAYADTEHGLVAAQVLPTGRRIETTYARQPDAASGRAVPGASLPDVSTLTIYPGAGSQAPSSIDSVCTTEPSTNGSPSSLQWSYLDHHYRTHQPGLVLGPISEQRVIFEEQGAENEPRDRGMFSGSEVEVTDAITGTTQTISTSLERDDAGRVTKVSRPRGGGEPIELTTTFEDESALPSSTQLAGDLTTTYRYVEVGGKSRGFVEEILEPEGVRRTFQVNALGWVLEACRDGLDAGSEEVCSRYEHDELGRVVKELRQESFAPTEFLATTFVYGPLGEIERTEIEIAPGQTLVETRDYDANRNLVELDRTGSHAVHFEYDQRNRLIRRFELQDTPGQIETRYRYDGEDRLTQTTQVVPTGQGEELRQWIKGPRPMTAMAG